MPHRRLGLQDPEPGSLQDICRIHPDDGIVIRHESERCKVVGHL